MNRLFVLLVSIALLGATPGCNEGGHAHDATGGHAHDEGPTTVAVTHWTDRTELFMEYPVLVAGRSGRSAIHVTGLPEFSPLSSGQASVVFRSEGGRVVQFRGGPSSPGIFGVDLMVDAPGVYDMSLRIDAPGLQDVHELGSVTVRAPGDPLPAAPDEGEAISFLKEQQWTLEFGTVAATVRGIRSGLYVPGTIEPRSGGSALLSAPVSGRIDPASRVPVPGTRVSRGEVLAQIAPLSDDLSDAAGLLAAVIEAEQAHLLAVREGDRAERLVEARAVPQRRLDEANATMTGTKARLDAARERWSRYESISQSAGGSPAAMFALRAPFDGVVSEVRYSAGVSVEVNEPLVRIVDPDRVHVVGAVPEAFARQIADVAGAELESGEPSPIDLGKPLTVNPVLDPTARTVEVRFSLDNRESRLHVGQSVKLQLFLGAEDSGTAVPESAIVDDGGRPVVFVQTGGESFERRAVRLGNAAEGYVHVLEGIEPGERVVHRGAYLVRLAAMSTQIPAHGHVH